MPELDPNKLTELVEQGGPIVVVLLILSVVALAVSLFKAGEFVFLGVGRGAGAERALQAWFTGRLDEASAFLSGFRNPTARVLFHAMSGEISGIQQDVIREDSERVALDQLASLRSGLRVLEATAQLAPLLGLFGTVVGMMQAFQALQESGAASDPSALAGGIWVALITTAVGLAVAIPAAFALYWFEGRIEREKVNMEGALTSFFTHRMTAPKSAGRREVPARAAE